MAPATGPGQARREALAARFSDLAEADGVLAEVLAGAHAQSVAARGRLDAIAAEIDAHVRNQAALALDTAAGAREFQRLLIAKHREITAIVAEARSDAAAKQALLESVRARYAIPAAASDDSVRRSATSQ